MESQVGSQIGRITPIISRFIAETKYDEIPDPIKDRVKKSILDTLGIIMPASELMPDLKAAIELQIEAGGKQESTVLGYGVKLPCWAATFANGVRGHSLDYADGHLEAVFRVGISVIPAALALAERKGRVSGKELIVAVAVAEELLCRIGVAIARRRTRMGPWHPGIVLGNFAAAAAAARMLELTPDQVDRAFGIAFLQTGGTLGVTAPDANIRGMYAGFVGRNGVLAAFMAQKGILGPRDSLGSKEGLLEVYFQGNYDRDYLLTKLGSEYELINLSFKPWPACAFVHPYIDAMLSLRRENSLHAGDIERVDVYSGEFNRELCRPINVASGQVPKTTNDGKRSITFNVALAALKGKVGFRDFTSEALRDPEVLGFAEKVQWVAAPEFDEVAFSVKGNQLPPGKVRVTTKDGRNLVKRIDYPYGHHLNPIQFEDLVQKFRDCLSLSRKSISPQATDRLIEMILHLEDLADIDDIVRILA